MNILQQNSVNASLTTLLFEHHNNSSKLISNLTYKEWTIHWFWLKPLTWTQLKLFCKSDWLIKKEHDHKSKFLRIKTSHLRSRLHVENTGAHSNYMISDINT